MLTGLLPYVDQDDAIPAEVMLAVLHDLHDREGTRSRRDIANRILQGAGDYLPSRGYLSDFIAAKMSDDEAREIIALRKRYIERLRNLLPMILRLVGLRDEDRLYSTLLRIDDCCHDFPIVRGAPHAKTTRKKVVAELRELKAAISNLTNAMDKAKRYVDIEFRHHSRVVGKQPTALAGEGLDLTELREQLVSLRSVTEIVLYKDEIGDDAFYVGDNKAKTHVVETAYEISIRAMQPQFVTTPGSDFSLLCGLLFEAASGEPDASLAGAINKFAKSDLREQLDGDHAEAEWENSDEYAATREADNFAHVSGAVEGLSEEVDFWRSIAADPRWDVETKRQFELRMKDVLDAIEDAKLTHGPHLVWASHMSAGDFARYRRRDEEWDADMLELEILNGQLQRKLNLILREKENRGQHSNE